MTDSEFRSYKYITENLRTLGWDIRNPSKGGSVYTQGEFFKHDKTLADGLGLKKPENIVVFESGSEVCYWVIEAKSKTDDLSVALKEAQTYCEVINMASGTSPARLVSAVAGSPDESIIVQTKFWDGDNWQDITINNYATTGFISQSQCIQIIESNSPSIGGYEVNLDEFLVKANEINHDLHINAVTASERACLVAGLLLALVKDNDMSLNNDPATLVNDINARIEALLKIHGKLVFFDQVTLKLPATAENHFKYRRAIVRTVQHLREMNVRSAINSGADALGQFYETFLKYANDASEMGIVLTPRHITKFAAEVVGVGAHDVIYDPTCGTGGFLVAALDKVRETCQQTDGEKFDAFRNDNLYGIEQSDRVFSIALVNMIFRGDGSSKIHNGNCFDNQFNMLSKTVKRQSASECEPNKASGPFTRIFMNPPFAVSEPECDFVDHAILQAAPSAKLFAILPNGPITGDDHKKWRKNLLLQHTVKAVIRMQDDLFYPVANKGTYAIILETWRPHRIDDLVYFGILFDGQSASQKSKLIAKATAQDNMNEITDDLRKFMQIGDTKIGAKPREKILSPLKLDGLYDFASEAYLSSSEKISIAPEKSIAGVLKMLESVEAKNAPFIIAAKEIREFQISELIQPRRGQCPPAKGLGAGKVPLITTRESNNGVHGMYDVPTDQIKFDLITISANGSGGKAFYHPYQFGAVSDVLICNLLDEIPNDPALKLYICEEINNCSWRYDYYRKCSVKRMVQDVRIRVPMKNGKIDITGIKLHILDSSPSFSTLEAKLIGLKIQ
ncbi:HsdM family class I SAM-dependent methyltransferase [Candidatus Puniceispirillum marinum]|uniref:site-specific DNA-methyltransferase (adenine-specific) n=1 Tax=Puniceispirillum marinum (strain IMCC1322) TaxID=488538 RepID=D5BRJ9_PUNMI|nr:N-6 DNA methylase [Candidatus Puniceispirillum marinum]ADE38896.1 N-6 DNA methylase [Candidatus Puniceispirillum marinum IMCC1322]